MVQLNTHFKELKREYVFPIIEDKLNQFKSNHPEAYVINLGIGDIALPLVPTVAEALCKASKEMTTVEGKRGYGPSEGYFFLRKRICDVSYSHLDITPDEIFVSEGTNPDSTHLQELFGIDCKIGIPDPTYPAYLDSAIMGGRIHHITLLPCEEKNHFSPQIPNRHLDVIYLCTPSNPTGVAMTTQELRMWVDYAKEHHSVLIVDNAYEAFITSQNVPKSIYEIEGAKEVAIELRSFSKSAGFTGLRCAYAVVPQALLQGELNALWRKRQSVKTNGVSYVIQRAAEAALSKEGLLETSQQVRHYLSQANMLRQALVKNGFSCFGGMDAPYVWWKIPTEQNAWEFFETVLQTCHLITIPGTGFGHQGEGYLRLSAFTNDAPLAAERLCNLK
jgi:LL-diaminopimelate aminotransferase